MNAGLRRDSNLTINDDSDNSHSSDDSYVGSSGDESDLDVAEKLFQREIIKNFIAIK